jgi:hypothetical protein
MAIMSLVLTLSIKQVSQNPPGTGDFQMMKTPPCQASDDACHNVGVELALGWALGWALRSAAAFADLFRAMLETT